MIGYIACVYSLDEYDPENVHEYSYEVVENQLSEKDFHELTSGIYKSSMRHDHEAFNEQLPFYSIKIIYVSIVRSLFKAGIPITLSTLIPSLISTLILIFFIYYIIEKESGNSFFAGIVSLIILFLPATISVARLATPDALSTLLLFSAAVVYVKDRNSLILFLLMPALVGTRTDNIIWCFILLFADSFLRQHKLNELMKNVLLVLILSAIWITIDQYFDNGGWEILFYHSFIEKMSFPLSTNVDLTFKQYLNVLIKSSWFFMPWFLVFGTLTYLLWSKTNKDILSKRGVIIVITCFLTFATRFFLFPAQSGRFYIALFLIILITSIIERKLFQSIIKKAHSKLFSIKIVNESK